MPLTLQLLVYGLTNGVIVGLSAPGFTIAYAVSRRINPVHGNVFAATTVAVASVGQEPAVTAAASLLERGAAFMLTVFAGAGIGAASAWASNSQPSIPSDTRATG